jgi:hypothetical protein
MTPAADDRPIRILERTPVPEAHKQRLFALVRKAQSLGTEHNADLQAEFGKEHVALIANHNQFLRLFRGGAQPGCVELWIPPSAKPDLEGRFTLQEPEGAVFRLFGWVRLDPMQGPEQVLLDAVEAAFRRALKPK